MPKTVTYTTGMQNLSTAQLPNDEIIRLSDNSQLTRSINAPITRSLGWTVATRTWEVSRS